MRYLVSYDLVKPGKDYSTLIAELKRLGANTVLRSQWVLRWNSTTAKKVANHVRKFMDSNDRVVVVQIDGTDWYTWNAINKIGDM